MKRLAIVVCVVLLLGGCTLVLAGAAFPSRASDPVLISHTGTWKFSTLGLPRIVVRPGTLSGLPRIAGRVPGLIGWVRVARALRLPTGARQGPDKWWRLLLHYEVDIAPDSGPGQVIFSVSVGDWASAQIEFLVSRDDSGKMVVSSDSLGMVGGHIVEKGSQLVWRGTFENYIPNRGIRPGVVPLGVKIEHLPDDQARAARAVVFPDSAIVYRAKSPARLSVQLERPPVAHVGERVPIRLTVQNVGGLRTAAGLAGVSLIHQPAGVQPPVVHLAPLDGGESRTLSFYVTPKKVGDFQMLAAAQAGLSKPQKSATLHVLAKPAAPGLGWWWWLVIVGAASAAVGHAQAAAPQAGGLRSQA